MTTAEALTWTVAALILGFVMGSVITHDSLCVKVQVLASEVRNRKVTVPAPVKEPGAIYGINHVLAQVCT